MDCMGSNRELTRRMGCYVKIYFKAGDDSAQGCVWFESISFSLFIKDCSFSS